MLESPWLLLLVAGLEALTLLPGTMLLVQAGLATATAFQIRPLEGWGWFLFDAVTTLFRGILILVKWPSSSVWVIGTLVGVAVLMGGISRTVLASKIRSGIGKLDRAIHPATQN